MRAGAIKQSIGVTLPDCLGSLHGTADSKLALIHPPGPEKLQLVLCTPLSPLLITTVLGVREASSADQHKTDVADVSD